MSTATEVQRLLGAMNSREIEVLKRLVSAQVSLADGRYMNGIYLPSLEERLIRAMTLAARTENPSLGRGEVDMRNEDGVSYNIVFKSDARVPCIKLLRELWGYGLKEAKDISDLAWNSNEVWNTLTVRNDTHFNMVNLRSLISDHQAMGRRLGHIRDEEDFARVEQYVEPVSEAPVAQ